MFSSSSEVFSWLSKFINLERGQKPKSFRLDRMEALADLAGNPQKCAPSIHVAGSKGKGSVTAMLSAILTAAGLKTARYMSPHVVDIRERISINDKYFNEDVYCTAGNELRDLVEIKLPSLNNPLFDPTNEEGCEPTYFELLTLFFFLCAKHGNCDAMVVETGMGGRLDSTNILDPLVSVITLIELEHTSFLGNTIEKVAGEKAGIIKHGKPLILAKQCKEALEVFKKKAEEKNSSLVYFLDTTNISNLNINPQGTDFTLSFKAEQPITLSIPIPGKVQAENACLAIAAVKTAFPDINNDAICRGLAKLKIPARFEKISETPVVIIDGAHTPESLDHCIKTFCSLFSLNCRDSDLPYGILLFGCAADKDAQAMAKIAHEHFSKIIITTPGTFKISSPTLVYEAFVEETGREKTELVLNTKEAVKKALEYAKSQNLPILGTGSFYLVSEIREIIL